LLLSKNLRGAAFMSISMAGFTLNDTLVKAASAEMNMGQVMFIRGLFATALLLLLAHHRSELAGLRKALTPLVLLRLVGEFGGTIFYLIALAHLPIANVSAVFQALPLAVTLGALLFLGERVGWRRWLAIAVGFVGILVIVRPGFEGFTVYSVYTLICVVFCALRDLITTRIPQSVPTLHVSVITAIGVSLFGGVLVVPMGGWSPVSGGALLLLSGASVLLIVGYQFIIMSMRAGDVSFVAPFRYTSLLWALVMGFLVFSDVPDLLVLVGSALVVGSGIYTIYRERVTGRAKTASASTNPEMIPDGM
jgi:drug/metabolite transporter (DMT)-like permease